MTTISTNTPNYMQFTKQVSNEIYSALMFFFMFVNAHQTLQVSFKSQKNSIQTCPWHEHRCHINLSVNNFLVECVLVTLLFKNKALLYCLTTFTEALFNYLYWYRESHILSHLFSQYRVVNKVGTWLVADATILAIEM